MKYMKKLITLLAALTLALAMAVPAFAASGTASSTGTITINNAVTGTTYKAYRIFDLESYDTNKDVYSYKLNTNWKDFPAYSTTIDGKTVSAAAFFSVNSAGYIEWNDAKKDAGADFAKLAKAFVDANTIATVYKGNIIKNLIMDCQSYTKYRPNETTGGIFVSWRRKEELPTGA